MVRLYKVVVFSAKRVEAIRSNRILKQEENLMIGTAIDIWVEKLIRAELGDTSRMPTSVQGHIFTTYRNFACAYLEWLRMDQEQPHGWIPEAAELKTSLVLGMAHFYSSHQHLVSEMNLLKSRVRRLQSLDCRSNAAACEECVDHILHGVEKRATFNRIYAELKEENL